MNDIMNENYDDYENPFIECELCETMVRFNDYNAHIEQCNRMRTQYVPPFVLPFYRQLGIRPPGSVSAEEEQGENDEAQENGEGQAQQNTGNFHFQYVFQIPTGGGGSGANEDGAGEEADEDAENDDMPELVSDDADYHNAEHDIENPPPPQEIPNTPLNYQIHFDFSVPLSSLPPLVPLPPHGEENQDQDQGQGENNHDTENEEQTPNLPVAPNFQQLLQNIRQGNVQVSDIASFILNENLIQNEELIPLLGNHIRRQQGTVAPTPFETIQNHQQTREAIQLPSLATLLPLPPFPLVDDYEYNLMLANRLGKVERGIANIDEVSKVVEQCEATDICPICQDTIEDIKKEQENAKIRKTICDHVFCDKCIKTWLEKNVRCPVCNVDLDDMAKMKKEL